VCEHQIASKNEGVDGFTRMIGATISSMSAAKQAVAMKEVTHLVMSIKGDPDEDYE